MAEDDRRLAARSAKSQKATLAALFDDFVGTPLKSFRERDPERFRGLEVEGQHDVGGLFDRQIGQLFPIKNLTGVDADAMKRS